MNEWNSPYKEYKDCCSMQWWTLRLRANLLRLCSSSVFQPSVLSILTYVRDIFWWDYNNIIIMIIIFSSSPCHQFIIIISTIMIIIFSSSRSLSSSQSASQYHPQDLENAKSKLVARINEAEECIEGLNLKVEDYFFYESLQLAFSNVRNVII